MEWFIVFVAGVVFGFLLGAMVFKPKTSFKDDPLIDVWRDEVLPTYQRPTKRKRFGDTEGEDQ